MFNRMVHNKSPHTLLILDCKRSQEKNMQDQKSGLSRRNFLKVMAVASAPLVLAACATPAGAPAGGTQGGAASQAPVELRFVAMDYDSRMQPDTQAVMDAF